MPLHKFEIVQTVRFEVEVEAEDEEEATQLVETDTESHIAEVDPVDAADFQFFYKGADDEADE